MLSMRFDTIIVIAYSILLWLSSEAETQYVEYFYLFV